MLTRPDDINNIEYWAYRLSEAEKVDNLQYSVYLTNKTNWKTIWDAHKQIFEKNIPKGVKILDAGCGYGRMSEDFPENDYTGVDFAPALLGKAKTLYPEKKFILAELDKLPFKNKEFDWVICASIKNMVIGKSSPEHWDRMEKELKRVGKKILILEYSFDPNEFEIL